MTACGAILFGLVPLAGMTTASASTVTTPVFATGASWKYLDTGADQGENWVNKSFDDSGWQAGQTHMGYGDGDEAKVIGWGPNGSNNKSMTSYFRKNFNVVDASKVQAVNLRVKRDDGIVVHVNGVEVGRNNMPVGEILHSTPATVDASDDGNTWRNIVVPVSALTSGENTIAVEIHQAAPNSSDLSFDADLTLTETAATPVGSNNGFPAGSNWHYLDAGQTPATGWNGDAAFNVSTWEQGVSELGYGDADEATVVDWAGTTQNKNITTYFRKNFEIVDASKLATATVRVKRDDGIVVYVNGVEVGRNNMPAGAVTATTLASVAAADDGKNWRDISVPLSALTNGENVIATEIHQAVANSEDISFDAQLVLTETVVTPPPPPPPTTEGFAPGASWSYLDAGNQPAAGWKSNGHDVSTWKQGSGQFGYGEGDEATVVQWAGSSSNNKNVTTYFRKNFTVANLNQSGDIGAVGSAKMRVKRDDGIVVYVNGAEVARDNMPTGDIDDATLAATIASDDGQTWRDITVPVAALVQGENTVAVSVHQSARASSDLSFDADLALTREEVFAINTPTHNYTESSGVEQVGNTKKLWFTEDFMSTKLGVVHLQNEDGSSDKWVRYDTGLPNDYANRKVGTVDTEAIAIHDGYMYVADIGDAWRATQSIANGGLGLPKRPYQTITRFPVPDVSALAVGENIIAPSSVEQVKFEYSRLGVGDLAGSNLTADPIGTTRAKRNAESLIIDPSNGKMIVVEKRSEASNRSRVWEIPAQWGNSNAVVAPQVAGIVATVDGTPAFAFSDAAVSPDGKTAWLRDAANLYKFPISVGETVVDALKKTPTKTAIADQPLGEGLDVDSTGRYLIAQSEGLKAPYKVINTP